MLVATSTEDRHGVWSPSIFKLELERALTTAFQRSRAAQTRSERRARRAASRALAPTPTVERHRLEATPTIQLADWYSDAPTPTREEQATAQDEATLAWLHRDEAPAPRGFGMTEAEVRRQWHMNARLRYRDALDAALRKHRGRVSKATAKAFPALRAEEQFARSVLARHGFVDELRRHGVHDPDARLVAKLKAALAPTYAEANAKLATRRRLAERGLTDRYRHELAA